MIKKSIKAFFLFIAGILLGAILFVPKDALWTKALKYADDKLSGVTFSWSGISDAGLMSFTINNLHIQTKSKKTNVYLKQLGIGFGIGTLLDLKIKTGPTMRVRIHRDKNIDFRGGLDVFALLRRDDLKGVIDLKGDVLMAEWTKPPLSGHVDIKVPEINLPGGFFVADAMGTGDLAGDVLAIPSFSTGKPLAASGRGELKMNFENFRKTTYTISGSADMGGKEQTFNVSGKMGDLGF